MTRRNLPIAFYLLLVFVSGSVVGALGYRTYNPPTARGSAPPSPSEWRQNYIDESRSRLNLTEDQVAKLTAILDQTDARFHEVHESANQQIRQIKEEHMARVRMILTADQLPKYEKLHEEREARTKQQEQQKKR
jgi:hypothetical protein